MKAKRNVVSTMYGQYRKIPCLDEDSDPLSFWRGYDVPGSVLVPLLPLAALIAAVSVTEVICERLFKKRRTGADKRRIVVYDQLQRSSIRCFRGS